MSVSLFILYIFSVDLEIKVEYIPCTSIFFQISAATLPYEEACQWCGGFLPDYIAKVLIFLLKNCQRGRSLCKNITFVALDTSGYK